MQWCRLRNYMCVITTDPVITTDYLASAIQLFNSSVPPSEAINSEALLLTPVTQKSLSSRLDDHLLKVLFNMALIVEHRHLALPAPIIFALIANKELDSLCSGVVWLLSARGHYAMVIVARRPPPPPPLYK